MNDVGSLFSFLSSVSGLLTKLIDFFQLTKEYVINVSKLFINTNASLPLTIVGIAFLWAILKGGLIDNWKIIIGALILAAILSMIGNG